MDRPQLSPWLRWLRGCVHRRGAVATGVAGALAREPSRLVRVHGGEAAGAPHGPYGSDVPCLGGRDEAGVSGTGYPHTGFDDVVRGSFVVMVCGFEFLALAISGRVKPRAAVTPVVRLSTIGVGRP